MERDILSVRQVMVLLMVALLAPATDLLPTVAAQSAGRGGWLIVLGALPVLLLAVWGCSRVFCGDGICEKVGKPVGVIVIVIYLVWILFVLAAALRMSVARMEVIYSKVPPILFSVLMTAVAVWMGMGKASALARAAEIFYLALTMALAGVLLLAALKVEWKNLCPTEWQGLPIGSAAAAGICLSVVPAAILGARVPKKARNARNACGWVIAFCAVITLVLAAVLGTVGSALSARLNIPYLIMVQGLGVKGAFQRMEALIAAVWLLSDVTLAGVLLRAWQEYAAELMPKKWSRRSVPAAAILALGAVWLLFSGENNAAVFPGKILSAAGIVLGMIVPVLLLLLSRFRGTTSK